MTRRRLLIGSLLYLISSGNLCTAFVDPRWLTHLTHWTYPITPSGQIKWASPSLNWHRYFRLNWLMVHMEGLSYQLLSLPDLLHTEVLETLRVDTQGFRSYNWSILTLVLANTIGVFMICQSDAFLSDYLTDLKLYTQNKTNFVKNCPSGVWTHNLQIISFLLCQLN